MRSQLFTYIWRKMVLKYSYHWHIFSFQVAIDIIRNYEDPKVETMDDVNIEKIDQNGNNTSQQN